ncbi:hypothetical protein BFP97_12900 [Roseivirga sp. 4D4]|uniref:endonuclease domain-containing protein n=1 Tax=Roseivirga sp. 4D4 TaxID=1889784 RepID=UPI000853E401|nr:endonuclease domain-containing protein [Roseivirga sp. 4D4]OEK02365.1 hypothetical protein BFP97_12900 [Roseivirga sp. 4D4]
MLTARAKQLRRNMTTAEAMVWKLLKGKQMKGYDFDRQRPIDQYIVDFYCKDLMLAIEIDGSSHDSKEAQEADLARQQTLEKLGVRFLRIRDEDVKEDVNSTYFVIKEWIENFEIENKGKPLPGRLEQ